MGEFKQSVHHSTFAVMVSIHGYWVVTLEDQRFRDPSAADGRASSQVKPTREWTPVMLRQVPRLAGLAGLPGFLRLWLVGGMAGEIGR